MTPHGGPSFTVTCVGDEHDRTHRAVAAAAVALTVISSFPAGAAPNRDDLRIATFNPSLNRAAAGELVADLSTPDDPQAREVAEVVQRVRPDVLLVNEFDYAPEAVDLFRDGYLEVGQNGAEPIEYPYAFIAPSNTGVPSGFDVDNSGAVGGPNDALVFGFFPGQFGMLVLSRFPLGEARTFRDFTWADLPGNRIPAGGPEDRNGTRNADEILFWRHCVQPGRESRALYDDEGRRGGLRPGERFVIMGDQDADLFDGDSVPGAAQQILTARRVVDLLPGSDGGVEAARLDLRVR